MTRKNKSNTTLCNEIWRQTKWHSATILSGSEWGMLGKVITWPLVGEGRWCLLDPTYCFLDSLLENQSLCKRSVESSSTLPLSVRTAVLKIVVLSGWMLLWPIRCQIWPCCWATLSSESSDFQQREVEARLKEVTPDMLAFFFVVWCLAKKSCHCLHAYEMLKTCFWCSSQKACLV